MANSQIDRKSMSKLNAQEVLSEAADSLSDNAFGRRLTLVIGEESFHSFARRSGVGESLLRSYVKGTTPRVDKVIAIAKTAKVSIEWLLTGEGSMSRQGTVNELDDSGLEIYSNGRVEDTHWLGSDAFSKALTQLKHKLLEDNPDLYHTGVHVKQMKDTSMSPTIQVRDWFITDPTSTDLNRVEREIYTYCLNGKEFTRRFSLEPDNIVKVTMDSSPNECFTIDLADPPKTFSIVGKVIAVFRLLEVPPFNYG